MDTVEQILRIWVSTAVLARLIDLHEVTIRLLRKVEGGTWKQGHDYRRIGAKGFRIQWHRINAEWSLTDWKGVIPAQEETFSWTEPLVDR